MFLNSIENQVLVLDFACQHHLNAVRAAIVNLWQDDFQFQYFFLIIHYAALYRIERLKSFCFTKFIELTIINDGNDVAVQHLVREKG